MGRDLKNIKDLFAVVAKQYNAKKSHAQNSRDLVCAALDKLRKDSLYGYYGEFKGRPNVSYYSYSIEGNFSRPIRPDLFIDDSLAFTEAYEDLLRGYNKVPAEWSIAEAACANSVIYTGVMAIACCFDLWQRGSRKTPGTFFEILMAGVLKELFSELYFSKHIPLTEFFEDVDLAEITGDSVDMGSTTDAGVEHEESASSLSTDLVIKNTQSGKGLVIPLKITTRERIVQPFAHQRILNSAFGSDRFTSFIVCISETQQDAKNEKVKQVCVPGTIKLFQKYLAPIGGLYYCDVPQRYDADDMQKIISTKSVGNFFIDAYHFFELK